MRNNLKKIILNTHNTYNTLVYAAYLIEIFLFYFFIYIYIYILSNSINNFIIIIIIKKKAFKLRVYVM